MKTFWIGLVVGVVLVLVLQLTFPRAFDVASLCGIPDKGGELHREKKQKQEKYQKPGKLIPNPGLPQWKLYDVPTDHWAYDEIKLIYSYGITVGCSYDPPLYCPDRPMTRAEAAVFAARLIELMGGEK